MASNTYRFLDANGSFILDNAENDRSLYFPLANEAGLKSAVTPNLAGDAKTDQNHFLLEPESVENLHNNGSTRNFWCSIEKNGKTTLWSATGASSAQEVLRGTDEQEASSVAAGYMWHTTTRESAKLGIKAEITSFVPVQNNVEIMSVTLTNTSAEAMTVTPTTAIPVYGRSADNIRDHRHVTALLHRSVVTGYGLEVRPTLSFDERGHQVNDTAYFVYATDVNGKKPVGCVAEVAAFLGHSGSYLWPESLRTDAFEQAMMKAGDTMDGQELVGALRMDKVTLAAGESTTYYVYVGICANTENIENMMQPLLSKSGVEAALAETKAYWLKKVNVAFHTGDVNFDEYMAWVSFQPELRRVFGCSFLPHHDYGKGGRGWRDLWQDCLALLMMDPSGVRQMLVSNFGGVRMDGSNATIIGNKQGEFKADRNSITRVWMDHGVWPMITTKLYMDQTGDSGILYEEVPYFKDRQVARGTKVDTLWTPDVKWQQDEAGQEYHGTILEHLLLQNMTSFYEVGEHGNIRLRDADWNDAIDMAGHRGESVAFTNAYAMNLETLSQVLQQEADRGVTAVTIAKEMALLLANEAVDYNSIEAKTARLAEYMEATVHNISGEKVAIEIGLLIQDLHEKAEWLKNHIRTNEWVNDGKGHSWYNGYYDDHARRVEGVDANGDVRMMLTGQVFSIMAGTATDEQVKSITDAADTYLYDAKCGGYRLNTDFHEVKTDMGRMFGFAFGEKENGAVFSHMAVMYANALYSRGFVKEGFKSLNTLYRQSMDYANSRIYPGVPEYFGKDGRGLYHYLTGAASWYMLTVLTQMFGVHGEKGDLLVEPKLLLEQFDAEKKATVSFAFAGAAFTVTLVNSDAKEYGAYEVKSAIAEGLNAEVVGKAVKISKDSIKEGATYAITVNLG